MPDETNANMKYLAQRTNNVRCTKYKYKVLLIRKRNISGKSDTKGKV